MAKGRGHGTRLVRGRGQFAIEAHQGIGVAQDIQTAPNQGRGGTYQSRGNLMRRGGARERGHGPTQPWRTSGSNLVTNIRGGTNPHMSGVQDQRNQSQIYHS